MRNCIFLIVIFISFFIFNCTKINDNNDVNRAFGSYSDSQEIQSARTNISSQTVEIRERMFATQVNEIYLNARSYLGRTINLEGIFKAEGSDEEPVLYVIRYTSDSCCGESMIGFEVRWPNGQANQYPAGNTWVEATGVLKEYRSGFNRYLFLELSSLNIPDRRGAEFVTR